MSARKTKAARKPVRPVAVVPPGSPLVRERVEADALNFPAEGLAESLGDLILKVIAPGISRDMDERPDAWEPPEAAALRLLAEELDALRAKVAWDTMDRDELASLLERLGERAKATCELAYRVRTARYGTSPTWGGVPRPVQTLATAEGSVTP